MSIRGELPPAVSDLLLSSTSAQFSTVSAAGVPIDTPLLAFPTDDLAIIRMATGLAYPAKAERARRNPKVGLLFEGALPGEPVVAIAGVAAVRDTDLQANLDLYTAETSRFGDPSVRWSIRHKAIWYWARIIIEIVPKEILWWDDPAQIGGEPNRWTAPANTIFPPSDVAPRSAASRAPQWNQPDWQELAASVIAQQLPGHVSLVDEGGFPRPWPVDRLQRTESGFSFDLHAPAGVGRHGPASLTFFGRETFIGQVRAEGQNGVRMTVERALPILPLMADPDEAWNPRPEVRQKLLGRLDQELARRGQPRPTAPEIQPEPTAAALARSARDARLREQAIFSQIRTD